jgi:hypothetical protein
MRRLIATVFLVLLAACGDDAILPGGGPVDLTFRAISERQNAGMCVRGPEFAVARDAAEWRSIWDRQTGCQPDSGGALPPLLATEAGVAAWWRVEGCLGHGVKTTRVTANGPDIVVRATSSAPAAEFCATALGGLESFLAFPRGALQGTERVRFILDDVEVGSVAVPS